MGTEFLLDGADSGPLVSWAITTLTHAIRNGSLPAPSSTAATLGLPTYPVPEPGH